MRSKSSKKCSYNNIHLYCILYIPHVLISSSGTIFIKSCVCVWIITVLFVSLNVCWVLLLHIIVSTFCFFGIVPSCYWFVIWHIDMVVELLDVIVSAPNLVVRVCKHESGNDLLGKHIIFTSIRYHTTGTQQQQQQKHTHTATPTTIMQTYYIPSG